MLPSKIQQVQPDCLTKTEIKLNQLQTLTCPGALASPKNFDTSAEVDNDNDGNGNDNDDSGNDNDDNGNDNDGNERQ